MRAYDRAQSALLEAPKRWTVTGAAGFIGSHIVETLLCLNQFVVGLDNFSTGSPRNLDDIRRCVGEDAWQRFRFIEGDICDHDTCVSACGDSDYLLHQAALGSIPRSIANPERSTAVNVAGYVNMLVAARDTGIRRIVYASSSSVYGDNTDLPKVESRTGRPLSPYAATKWADELFAGVFRNVYEMEILGLRYFNVFGPRQDPAGAYAAVIPRWIETLRKGDSCTVFGDGSTSRDFSFVTNIVQANILAATTDNEAALGEVFNIAAGGRTSLSELYTMIRDGILEVAGESLDLSDRQTPVYEPFRTGDVKHSQADISKARELLGFEYTHSVAEGLVETLRWHFDSPAPT